MQDYAGELSLPSQKHRRPTAQTETSSTREEPPPPPRRLPNRNLKTPTRTSRPLKSSCHRTRPHRRSASGPPGLCNWGRGPPPRGGAGACARGGLARATCRSRISPRGPSDWSGGSGPMGRSGGGAGAPRQRNRNGFCSEERRWRKRNGERVPRRHRFGGVRSGMRCYGYGSSR